MTNINRKIVHIIFWKRNAGMGFGVGECGSVRVGKAKELGEGEVRERWRWSWVWELGGEGKKGRGRVKRVGGEGTRVVCESGCGVCGCGSVGWSRFGFMFMELLGKR